MERQKLSPSHHTERHSSSPLICIHSGAFATVREKLLSTISCCVRCLSLCEETEKYRSFQLSAEKTVHPSFSHSTLLFCEFHSLILKKWAQVNNFKNNKSFSHSQSIPAFLLLGWIQSAIGEWREEWKKVLKSFLMNVCPQSSLSTSFKWMPYKYTHRTREKELWKLFESQRVEISHSLLACLLRLSL